MLDMIKYFFSKFKLTGGNGDEPTQVPPSKTSLQPQPHSDAASIAAQQQAAAAALARLAKRKEATPKQRSAALIRAQALKELKQEQQLMTSKQELSIAKTDQARTMPSDNNNNNQLAVSGIFYRCLLIGSIVLPKKDMDRVIKEFLYQQLEGAEEAGLIAAQIIHTVNSPPNKVQQCIEAIFVYLDNIINNPGEEKFKKIRIKNKFYQERVAPLEGVEQFLRAAGFDVKQMPNPQQEMEDFWVFSNTKPDHIEFLSKLRDGLVNAEPIRPELDRGLEILLPSQATKRVELPDDFFWLTVQEIKREQQLKTDDAERKLMLRTKAMRERDERAQQRKYRFALIRIKFPDGLMLQGTFKVNETMRDIRNFVCDALQDPCSDFNLVPPTGIKNLSNTAGDQTLLTLQLCPSAVLHFTPTVPSSSPYLKVELIEMIRSA